MTLINKEITIKFVKKKDFKTITVKSAHELNDSIKKRIEGMFNQEGVDIVFKHSPSIIGGIIVQTPEKMYDFSIKSKIEELKSTLYQNK